MGLITSTADAAQAKPVLHVECCTYTAAQSTVRKEVLPWMKYDLIEYEYLS